MAGQSMDADAIYKAFYDHAPGTNKLNAAQQAASEAQKMHPELCDMIRNISTKMDAAWQGQASTAAQGAANPLVQTSVQSGDELFGAQQAISNQSSAFTTAKSSIQKMPDAPGFWQRMNPFDDTMATDMKRMTVGLGNTAAYDQYVGASTSNQKALPVQYGTLTSDTSSVQVAPPAPPTNPGGTQYGGYNGQTGSYSRTRTGGGSYTGGGYNPQQPIQGGGGGPITGQPTPTPQPYQPPPDNGNPIGNDPAGFRPGDPGYNPNPGGGGFNPGGPGYNSGSGGADGPGGIYGGGGGFGSGGSGGSAGGSGGRFGSGGFGAGSEEGGFGPRGSGSGAKGPGGFGPGGAQEGAMGRGPGGMGAAGRSGSPGAGGMGAAGGRGGKGEDDGEHRTASYLQDDYSGEIVGDLGLTAPPVIGE